MNEHNKYLEEMKKEYEETKNGPFPYCRDTSFDWVVWAFLIGFCFLILAMIAA